MKLLTKLPETTMAALAVLLVASRTYGQGAVQWTVTFDGNPPIAPEDDIGIAQYFEANMWIRAIGPIPTQPPYRLGRTGGGQPNLPANGTAYVHAAFGDSLAVSHSFGLSFGLISVDLAEYSTVVPDTVAVQFVGYRFDGSTVTQEFTTDGIIDGTGPLADFQTFYFDARFADVVRVEVPTYGWSLDNMVFAQVPEPGTWTLLVLGGALAGCRFWKRRQRS